MFQLPHLTEVTTSRSSLSTFGGYNHNLSIGEGEHYDELNLSSEDYPVFGVSKPKGKFYFAGTTERTGYKTASRFPVSVYSFCESGNEENNTVFVGIVRFPANITVLDTTDYLTKLGLYIESEYGFKFLCDLSDYSIDEDLRMIRIGNRIVLPSIKKYYQFQSDGFAAGLYDIEQKFESTLKTIGNVVKTTNSITISDVAGIGTHFSVGNTVNIISEELDFNNISGTVAASSTDSISVSVTDTLTAETIVLHEQIQVIGGSPTYHFISSYPSNSVSFSLVDTDAESYSNIVVGVEAPADTAKKWLDISSKPHCLRVYSDAQEEWVSMATTYIKIHYPNIGANFAEGDGVKISGIKGYSDSAAGYHGETLQDINEKYSVIHKKGQDYIVVVGILDYEMKQGTVLKVERTMPDMDLIFECNNRLWGAKANEIYASKLGDLTNWNVFEGVSTDSYALSTGSSEKFTGGCAYSGNPIFFREKELIKIYGDYPANYQTQSLICDGVKRGCGESLAMLNGYLYYYSNSGLCVYTGSYPTNINDNFSGVFSNVKACAMANNLYIVANNNLFVYDNKKGIWHKQGLFYDVKQIFCNSKDVMFVAAENYEADYKGYKLISDEDYSITLVTQGGSPVVEYTEESWLKEIVSWFSESGDLTASLVDHKYVQKILVRMYLPTGSKLRMYISYDNEGYSLVFNAQQTALNTFEVPIRLRRCDRYRLKIEGEGDCRIYSITKTIIQGSDRH